MRLLTLSDVVAISEPERQRLREADEAIHDVVTRVGAQAAEDELDTELLSKAMIDLLLLAAARLALVAQPNSAALRLPGAFAELAQEAIVFAASRAAPRRIRDLH